ncbi:MAG: lysylphosphatidylglycerol synthase transmembrane domain-containing protein [Bacteroidales bacterium]
MKRILQNSLKLILPLLIGGGIIWYLYKGQNFEEMKQVLDSGIEWKWIFLSLLFAILSHVVRAIRWRMQFKALGYEPTVNELSNAVFGNYGINLIFPRLGEVWRCNFMAKRYKIPFTTVLGTMVSERLLDVMCIGLITLVTFGIEHKVFLAFFRDHPTLADSLDRILLSPWVIGGAALTLFLTFYFRKKIFGLSIFKKFAGLGQKLWEGVKTIQVMKHKWTFIFLTFGIWMLYFLNFYVCLYAFEFSKEVGLIGGLTMFVMGSLGIIVPVQGGTGPWHFMIISTMLLYGIGQTEASTFALFVHAIQQGFIILLGLYAMMAILLGDRLRKIVQPTVK